MYTMYTRASGLGAVVLLSVFAAASCGGDEPTAVDLSCVPNSKSVPRSASDPCPQNDAMCREPMYAAVSTCMPTGTWNTQCACVLASTLNASGGGGAGGAGPVCGNGVLEAGESCEPTLPITTNCAAMNMGAGAVTCTATCTFNTSACPGVMPPTGGNGA